MIKYRGFIRDNGTLGDGGGCEMQIGDWEEEVGSVAIERGAWIQIGERTIDLCVLNISTLTQVQATQTKYHFLIGRLIGEVKSTTLSFRETESLLRGSFRR